MGGYPFSDDGFRNSPYRLDSVCSSFAPGRLLGLGIKNIPAPAGSDAVSAGILYWLAPNTLVCRVPKSDLGTRQRYAKEINICKSLLTNIAFGCKCMHSVLHLQEICKISAPPLLFVLVASFSPCEGFLVFVEKVSLNAKNGARMPNDTPAPFVLPKELHRVAGELDVVADDVSLRHLDTAMLE